MVIQYPLTISTSGRGFVNITKYIDELVEKAQIMTGICHLFLHHTSASLILCENADPCVQADLEAFMQRVAPDGDPKYQHTTEGPDDMPAHIRTILTQSFLLLPITKYQLALGTWQGIYLWEHRLAHFDRRLTVTFMD